MSTIDINKAVINLYEIVQTVNNTHKPIHITSDNSSAILVGEDDWRNIQETLFLTSIPGMRESIIEGLNEPIQNLDNKLDW